MSTDAQADDQPTETVEELRETVRTLEQVTDLQDEIIDDQIERITDLENTVERLENTLGEYQRKVDATLTELDQRTDLLKDANAAQSSTTELRAAKLVQKLADKADRKGAKRVSLDAKEGWSTLNYEPDRTSVYDIYRKAEEIVGQPDVLYYKKESRGAKRSSRLVYDSTQGELPGVVAGTEIEECGSSTTRVSGEGSADTRNNTEGEQASSD